MIYSEVKKALEAIFVSSSGKITIVDSDIQVPIDLQNIQPVVGELRNQDETVAQELKVDLGGFKNVEVLCKADSPTTFTVIESFDGTTEDSTLYQSPTTETEFNQTYTTGARYLIVKSNAAGSAGDRVTLLVGAKP